MKHEANQTAAEEAAKPRWQTPKLVVLHCSAASNQILPGPGDGFLFSS